MKTFLVVLAISSFAACNDNETSAEKTVDSSAKAVIDSLKGKNDSVTKSSHSSLDQPVDSTAKVDSLK